MAVSAIILALAAGVSLAVQYTIMLAVIGSGISFPSALLINSVVGLAVLAAVEMTRIGPEFISDIINQARPWFAIPGLLGTFFVFASLYGYKHQGAAPTIVLVIAAQLLTGLALDSLGLTGASPMLGVRTVIGAVLLVIGAALVV